MSQQSKKTAQVLSYFNRLITKHSKDPKKAVGLRRMLYIPSCRGSTLPNISLLRMYLRALVSKRYNWGGLWIIVINQLLEQIIAWRTLTHHCGWRRAVNLAPLILIGWIKSLGHVTKKTLYPDRWIDAYMAYPVAARYMHRAASYVA